MSGEIRGINPALIQNNELGRTNRAEQTATSANSPAKASTDDTLKLTDTATKLQALEAKLDSMPVVDTERVEALRAAIAEGRFNVDSNDIAKKMVDIESALSALDK